MLIYVNGEQHRYPYREIDYKAVVELSRLKKTLYGLFQVDYRMPGDKGYLTPAGEKLQMKAEPCFFYVHYIGGEPTND